MLLKVFHIQSMKAHQQSLPFCAITVVWGTDDALHLVLYKEVGGGSKWLPLAWEALWLHRNPSQEKVKNRKPMMIDRVFGLLKRVSPKNAVVSKKCCRNAVTHPMPPGIRDPEKLEEVFLCGGDYFSTDLFSHLLNPSNAGSQHAPAMSSTLQSLFFVPRNIQLHLP